MKRLLLSIFAMLLTLSAGAQLEHCKEILSIRITGADGSSAVQTANGGAGLQAFGGHAESQHFKGDVLPGGFDNMKDEQGVKTLSARYMLEGTDSDGQHCKIFIENNALQGSAYSHPKIFTDSRALSFLNDAELVGLLDHSNGQFYVRVFVREESRSSEKIWIDGSHGHLSAVIEKPALKGGEQCPMVIICHGFGGSKEGGVTGSAALRLPKEGIATIRFDFNGHGESEGRFEDMTVPNEIEDARCIYRYIAGLPYVDRSRIAILGHSQGGVVASMTAGELDGKIAATVLMCPASVLRDDAVRGNTMGKQYNPLDPPEMVNLGNGRLLGREFIKTAFTLPIYETAGRYHGRACIIHGTGDRVVPYTYGLRYVDLWPGSEYHQLEGYDHGFNPDPEAAVSIAIDFLKRTLLPPAVTSADKTSKTGDHK